MDLIGTAYAQKTEPPLLGMTKEITIPRKLQPIVDAFFAESPKIAKKLIIQAAQAIYGSDVNSDYNVFTKNRSITDQELEEVCSFMQVIKPCDFFEAVIAAQIVVTHMLGIRNMAKGHIADQKLGLKMLQFSAESMSRLQKKRSGAVQNINIHYHGIKAESQPTVIPVDLVRD